MTISIKLALDNANKLLQAAGIPTHKLDARILLQHVTKLSHEEIIRDPERFISEVNCLEFNALIQKRSERKPVSQLVGKKEFYGREFIVTEDTLTPRPDSETLIDAALKLVKDKEKPLRILDFGTGTGCLLLTLLAELPAATGVGIDISPSALSVAKNNASKLSLEKRVEFLLQCWGEHIEEKYDLIVTNPPYIRAVDVDTLEKEVAVYEPQLALVGGEDGLECYRQIAPYISALLKDDGYAVIECGDSQEQDISTIISDHDLNVYSYASDLAGIVRCIIVNKQ